MDNPDMFGLSILTLVGLIGVGESVLTKSVSSYHALVLIA
jgi:hypothetical protein